MTNIVESNRDTGRVIIKAVRGVYEVEDRDGRYICSRETLEEARKIAADPNWVFHWL